MGSARLRADGYSRPAGAGAGAGACEETGCREGAGRWHRVSRDSTGAPWLHPPEVSAWAAGLEVDECAHRRADAGQRDVSPRSPALARTQGAVLLGFGSRCLVGRLWLGRCPRPLQP